MITTEEAIEILETIDRSGCVVSDWEAEFIDSIFAEDSPHLTPKRRKIIEEMEEKYL